MKKSIVCLIVIAMMLLIGTSLFGQNRFEFRHGKYLSTQSESSYIFIGSNNQFVEFWNWESIGDDRVYTYDPYNQVLRTFFKNNGELCSVHNVIYDNTPGREKIIFLYPDRSVTFYRKS